MNSKSVTARISIKLYEGLNNMVETGEARNLSDAVNRALDRYFVTQGD